MNPIKATSAMKAAIQTKKIVARRRTTSSATPRSGTCALTFVPESACAAIFCSGPNNSLMRLSTAAVSAMPHAVSGTSLASCGHPVDEIIAFENRAGYQAEHHRRPRPAEPLHDPADYAEKQKRIEIAPIVLAFEGGDEHQRDDDGQKYFGRMRDTCASQRLQPRQIMAPMTWASVRLQTIR